MSASSPCGGGNYQASNSYAIGGASGGCSSSGGFGAQQISSFPRPLPSGYAQPPQLPPVLPTFSPQLPPAPVYSIAPTENSVCFLNLTNNKFKFSLGIMAHRPHLAHLLHHQMHRQQVYLQAIPHSHLPQHQIHTMKIST